MVANLDYLTHIRGESTRFAEALGEAAPSDHVPTCPDWNADDLLWHLTEVQLFWSVIVRDHLADPAPADAATPARPDDRAGLFPLFERATAALIDALETTPVGTAIWTWAPDHTVGFALRHQAHEALMHRLDAELVTGRVTVIDPELASDGIDEALTIIHGDLPEWSTFTSDGSTGTIDARDTQTTWRVALGRFTGTSPNSGTTYDMDTLLVIDDPRAATSFTVRADAAQLDTWLWGRGAASALEVEGDRDAFARLEQIVARGVQ
jgi:uncharacterized protein (TIGR03083 family)